MTSPTQFYKTKIALAVILALGLAYAEHNNLN